jgi:hypothetical protein
VADPVKRVHYFDHQFLRADDFTAEQAYHQSLRRLHNRLLHTWGIAEGLEVSFQGGASSVTVSPGVAIDNNGREIVVTEDTPVELLNQPADTEVYVTISYSEEETDGTQETGAEGNTRYTERPQFVALRNAPSDPGNRLVLARATRTGTEVTALDTSDRRVAGAAGGLLDVLGLGLRDPNIASTSWVRLRLEAAGRANVSGSLSVSGALSVANALSVGGVNMPGTGSVALTGNVGTRGISPVAAHSGWAGGIHTYDLEAEASIWARNAIFVDGTLSVGTMNTANATLEVAGSLLVSGNSPITMQKSVLRLGTPPGSTAAADEVVGAVGFVGTGIRHGQLAYRPTRGFELVDVSNTIPRLDYAWDTRAYAALKVGSLMIGGAGSGTPFAGRLLQVDNSEILASGAGGGLSFADRTTAGVTDAAAGNRWVLYSSGKIARWWTSVTGDVLTIDSAGNVGIGVADAGARLQVGGGAIMPAVGNSATAGIQFPANPGLGSGDEAFLRYYVESGEATKLMLGINNDADDRLGFWQQGAERMTIYSGRVGIGTTSPDNQLSVVGGGTGIRQNKLYLSGGTAANPWSSLTFNAYHNDANNAWIFPENTRPAVTLEMDASPSGRFQVFGSTKAAPTTFISLLYLDCETGNLSVRGSISAGGGKGGYVTDQFVNAHGDALEQGDVVVLGGKDAALTFGVNDNIPIPEADMAQEAYDTRVCGIVAEVHGEVTRRAQKETAPGMEAPKPKRTRGGRARPEPTPRAFTTEELDELKNTEVKPGQIGTMVTLGAYAHCKVDAKYGAIEVGDLLTTSPTKGHAQKVLEPEKAVGAIIGKALGSRERGRGKIPVLVLLQ